MVLASKMGPAELMWAPLLVDDEEGPNGYGSGDAEGVWDLEAMRQWWLSDEEHPMVITKVGGGGWSCDGLAYVSGFVVSCGREFCVVYVSYHTCIPHSVDIPHTSIYISFLNTSPSTSLPLSTPTYLTPYPTPPPASQSQSTDLPPALLMHPTTVDWDKAWPAERDPVIEDGQFVHAEGLFMSFRTARKVTDALIAKVGKLV